MNTKLSWNKLLCTQRERESGASGEYRNEFDKDYDRIVYSSSIRRLQDKAQVFPLQENDFTRTRLTHSLEVSALAKSLGLSIGGWLREEGELTERHERELISLLQVAGLVHDIGNPPFGHYGEDILRNWFKAWLNSEKFKEVDRGLKLENKLSEREKNDLMNFEGNAQTIRILTKLQLLNDQYGVNFTYGTLSTLMKYPWASDDKRAKEKEKIGYFSDEADIIQRIYECTGLDEGMRHPATYLLEAADDIAYLCADIEDAVKKSIIPWGKEYIRIKHSLLKKNYDLYKKMFEDIDRQNTINMQNGIPEFELSCVQNFKIRVQGMLFNHAIEEFKENYKIIMYGEYGDKELIKSCVAKELVEELKKLAENYCFVDKEILTLELVGDKVITGLLDIFVNRLVGNDEEPKTKKHEGKLYNLISENFRYVCCFDYIGERKKDFKELRLYDKLLLITDFISGMTDSYAVNLYKKLIGVKLP